MLVRTLIILRNCDFEHCNGNIDYYTVTLPMSKKTFYPVRKVRIIEEYYTPRFKRDNSPDSCISRFTKSHSVCDNRQMFSTQLLLASVQMYMYFFKTLLRCVAHCASGAYLPARFSTEFIHLIKLLPTIACEKQEQQLTFVTKKIRSLKLRKLRSLIYTWQMGRCIPIHTAVCRSSSTSWSDYDIQFRLKRSRSPLFFLVDAELQLLYVVQTIPTQASPT